MGTSDGNERTWDGIKGGEDREWGQGMHRQVNGTGDVMGPGDRDRG